MHNGMSSTIPTSLGTNHLAGNTELQVLGIEYSDDIFDSIALDLDRGVSNPAQDRFENYYAAPGAQIASLDAVGFDSSVLQDVSQPIEDNKSNTNKFDEFAKAKSELDKKDLKKGNKIIEKQGAQDFLDDWYAHRADQNLDALLLEARVFNHDFLESQESESDDMNGTIYTFDPETMDRDDSTMFMFDPGVQDIALGDIKSIKPTLKAVKKDK